jgi:hypothetical protein
MNENVRKGARLAFDVVCVVDAVAHLDAEFVPEGVREVVRSRYEAWSYYAGWPTYNYADDLRVMLSTQEPLLRGVRDALALEGFNPNPPDRSRHRRAVIESSG